MWPGVVMVYLHRVDQDLMRKATMSGSTPRNRFGYFTIAMLEYSVGMQESLFCFIRISSTEFNKVILWLYWDCMLWSQHSQH